MPTLEETKQLIVNQAQKKGWNQETIEMLSRLLGEIEELIDAIFSKKKDPIHIADEIVDCLYFLLQIDENETQHEDLDESFNSKYERNWINKKKTRIGGKIVRK